MARAALQELDAAVHTATRDATSYFDALRLVMQAIIPLAPRHMFLVREDILSPDVSASFDKAEQELRELIDAAKAEDTLRADLPTEWVAQAYDHLIYAAWEMIRCEEATPRQAVALAWAQFSKGAAK